MTGLKVVYNAELDLPFCVLCKVAIEFDGVLKHIKRNYKLSRSSGVRMDGEILDARKSSSMLIR